MRGPPLSPFLDVNPFYAEPTLVPSRLKKELGVSLGFVLRSIYGFSANFVTIGELSR